jgi:hypothetical protein
MPVPDRASLVFARINEITHKNRIVSYSGSGSGSGSSSSSSLGLGSHLSNSTNPYYQRSNMFDQPFDKGTLSNEIESCTVFDNLFR